MLLKKHIIRWNEISVYFSFRVIEIDIKLKMFRPIILETLILRYELKGKARTFLGWFWVHAHNFTHVRHRSKIGAKYKNLNQKR